MKLYTSNAYHLVEGIPETDDPSQSVYAFFKRSIILGLYGNFLSQARYCEMKRTLLHDSDS